MNKLTKFFLLLFVSLTTLSSSCEDEIPEPTTPVYLKTGNFFDCSAGETFLSYDNIVNIETKGGFYLFEEGDNVRISSDSDLSTSSIVKTYENQFLEAYDYEFFGDDVLISGSDGLSLYETATGDLTLLADIPCSTIKVHNEEVYFSVPSVFDYSSNVVYKYSISDNTSEAFIDDIWLNGTFVRDFDFDPQGNLYVKSADNDFFIFDEEGNNTFSSVIMSSSDVSFTFFTQYIFDGEDVYFATLDPQVGFQLLKKSGDQTIRLKKILKDTDDEQDKLFVPFHVLGDIFIRDGKIYAGLQESIASECMGLFVFDITSDEELEPLDYYILTEEGRETQCVSNIVETEDGDIIYISEGKAYRADCG